MPHTTVFRDRGHSPHTTHRHRHPHFNFHGVKLDEGAVHFVYSFNEIQSQGRGGKTSLQSRRETPPVLFNLEIVISATEDPLQGRLLKSSSSLPHLTHYHTPGNKGSGDMCLGSQSSDGADATVTPLQSTHQLHSSKLRLLHLCTAHSGAQNSRRAVKIHPPPS